MNKLPIHFWCNCIQCRAKRRVYYVSQIGVGLYCLAQNLKPNKLQAQAIFMLLTNTRGS